MIDAAAASRTTRDESELVSVSAWLIARENRSEVYN